MKAFSDLTQVGRARRLRRLAELALLDFGLEGARLTYISRAANTTFRVDAPDLSRERRGRPPYTRHRFLLRIHRPGYQTAESIGSELAWLAALSGEARLAVPEPVETVQGAWLTTVSAPGVPKPRHCSLLRWMDGRFLRRQPHARHFHVLGRFMACLHEFACHWPVPADFVRRHWDWDGLFGDQAGSYLRPHELWDLLPEAYRPLFEEVAARVAGVMEDLGRGEDAYGLIHADMNLYNVLFAGGEPRVFDFDDCGFGYWIYDVAVTLSDWQESGSWPELRQAFLDGYREVRPLPREQLATLDLFMAAQNVAEALWVTDMAEFNPAAGAVVEEWQDWAADQVRQYLEE